MLNESIPSPLPPPPHKPGSERNYCSPQRQALSSRRVFCFFSEPPLSLLSLTLRSSRQVSLYRHQKTLSQRAQRDTRCCFSPLYKIILGISRYAGQMHAACKQTRAFLALLLFSYASRVLLGRAGVVAFHGGHMLRERQLLVRVVELVVRVPSRNRLGDEAQIARVDLLALVERVTHTGEDAIHPSCICKNTNTRHKHVNHTKYHISDTKTNSMRTCSKARVRGLLRILGAVDERGLHLQQRPHNQLRIYRNTRMSTTVHNITWNHDGRILSKRRTRKMKPVKPKMIPKRYPVITDTTTHARKLQSAHN